MVINPNTLRKGQILLVNGRKAGVEATLQTFGGLDVWIVFEDTGEDRNLTDEDILETLK